MATPGHSMTGARRASWMLCAIASLQVGALQASTHTLAECLEGGDFIANAARSRDNGVERAHFLDRLHADFAAIRAFPPALRWFARDGDDETFLVSWSGRVFEEPSVPERHRAAFLLACFSQEAGTAEGASEDAPRGD